MGDNLSMPATSMPAGDILSGVIQTPSADVAAPAIAPTAPAPTSQDPTLTAINSQPVAAPKQGQPSMWQRILQGALDGLAGSAGARSFGAGAAGGAAGAIRGQEQRRENAIQDQQLAQQKVAQQSNIRFQDAQSANLAAEASMKDAQLHALPEQLRQNAIASSISIMKELDGLGLRPVLQFPNTAQGASGAAQQLTTSHNGVPPTFTLNLGDQVVGYDLSQLAGAPQGLSVINQVNAIQGKPQIDQQMWNKMPVASRTQMMNGALNFWDPVPTKENASILAQQYQNNLDTYQKDPNADPALVKRLQDTVSNLKKISTGLDTHDIKQAAAKSGAEESARMGVQAKANQGMDAATKFGIQPGDDPAAVVSKLPPTLKGTMQGVLNYTVNPNTFPTRLPSGKGTPPGQVDKQTAIGIAKMIDPTYDETQFASRNKMRIDYTTGPTSKNVRAINTAVMHAVSFLKNSDKLTSFGFESLNAAKNASTPSFLHGNLSKAQADGLAFSHEISNAFKGSASTVSELEAWQKQFNVNMSHTELHAWVGEGLHLLSGRAAQIAGDWEKGMGTPYDFGLVNPQTKQALSSMPNGSELLDGMNITAGGAGEGALKKASVPAAQPTDPAAKFGGVTRTQ